MNSFDLHNLEDINKYVSYHLAHFGVIPTAIGVTETSFLTIWHEALEIGRGNKTLGSPEDGLETELTSNKSQEELDKLEEDGKLPDELYYNGILVVVNRFLSIGTPVKKQAEAMPDSFYVDLPSTELN